MWLTHKNDTLCQTRNVTFDGTRVRYSAGMIWSVSMLSLTTKHFPVYLSGRSLFLGISLMRGSSASSACVARLGDTPDWFEEARAHGSIEKASSILGTASAGGWQTNDLLQLPKSSCGGHPNT